MASFEHVRGNLIRQHKGLELLVELLKEEFSLLQDHSTEEVVALEFSIHHLLRQLADERGEVKAIMQDTRLREYADLLDPEQGAEIKTLVEAIDKTEQNAAKQASHNTRLSLALLDQSQSLLDFLHEQVTPRSEVVYGAKGSYSVHRPGPTLFNGSA